MEQKYIDLVEELWGEDEDFAQALYSMLGGDEKLLEKVVKEDLTFNRYTCDVSTWEDLIDTIINDPCFDNEEYKDYINSLKVLRYNSSEEMIKSYLVLQNWAIDTVNDIAIGFDTQVNIANHEI